MANNQINQNIGVKNTRLRNLRKELLAGTITIQEYLAQQKVVLDEIKEIKQQTSDAKRK